MGSVVFVSALLLRVAAANSA